MPNTTGEVMWSCNVTAIENEREKCKSLFFFKGTLSVHGLNYVNSLVTLRLAKIGRRSCRRYVRNNTLRNTSMKVGSVVYRNFSISVCASFSHYCCLIYTIFLLSMLFTVTVPMCGSEVTKSNTEIHLTNTPSEVAWACDVTTIEREGDFVRHMLLRLGEVVRRLCKRPEARNTLRNRLVVWSTAVLTHLSVLLFHIVVI